MCKVSIVVPVYQIKEKYLTECLDSLIHQTLTDIEIILIDDGSPDQCGTICEQYAVADKRIKVLHQENQGVSCARNNGIDIAVGEYLLMVDADDVLVLTACEELYGKARQTGADILLYGHRCFHKNQEAEHLLGKDIAFSEADIKELQKVILNPSGPLLTISPAGTVGKLYQTSFVKQNHLRYVPGLKRMQDNLFNLYAFQRAHSVYYYDFVGYLYRINSDSVCNKYNPGIFSILEDALTEFRKFVSYHAPEFEPYYFCKVITVLCNEYFKLYFRNKDNPKSRKILLTELKHLASQKDYYDAIRQVDLKLLSPRLRVSALLLRFNQATLLWKLLDLETALKNLLHKTDHI